MKKGGWNLPFPVFGTPNFQRVEDSPLEIPMFAGAVVIVFI
jgi:hypothetical protein